MSKSDVLPISQLLYFKLQKSRGKNSADLAHLGLELAHERPVGAGTSTVAQVSQFISTTTVTGSL